MQCMHRDNSDLLNFKQIKLTYLFHFKLNRKLYELFYKIKLNVRILHNFLFYFFSFLFLFLLQNSSHRTFTMRWGVVSSNLCKIVYLCISRRQETEKKRENINEMTINYSLPGSHPRWWQFLFFIFVFSITTEDIKWFVKNMKSTQGNFINLINWSTSYFVCV